MDDGRILFLYENEARFVHTDLEILRERYEIEAWNCSKGSTIRGMFRALRSADLSFSWLALGYAARAVLVGKVLQRPSIVVAGGWDVISMPELSYGAARSPYGRRRARFVLRHADALLTFSNWSRQTMFDLAGRDAEMMYLGVDLDAFRPKPAKEDLVVTVGHVSRENFARKGLETFVRAAAHAPDVRFVLAGKHHDGAADILRSIATPNVELPGWLSDEELRDLLARAKVYVQASYNEGFGLALAEAMAAGCVPVVTRMGSLPEVAGDVGFYAPMGDAGATAGAIREALTSNRHAAARERVATHFPLAARRKRLLAVVERLLGA